MPCKMGTFELRLAKKTRVRFEFDGELSLEQTMEGTESFELCGLVPDADGELVLFLDNEPTLAWDFTRKSCERCGGTAST